MEEQIEIKRKVLEYGLTNVLAPKTMLDYTSLVREFETLSSVSAQIPNSNRLGNVKKDLANMKNIYRVFEVELGEFDGLERKVSEVQFPSYEKAYTLSDK